MHDNFVLQISNHFFVFDQVKVCVLVMFKVFIFFIIQPFIFLGSCGGKETILDANKHIKIHDHVDAQEVFLWLKTSRREIYLNFGHKIHS